MIYRKTCEWCGKEFTAQKSNTRFCSKLCTDHAYKQKVRSITNEVMGIHDENKRKEVISSHEVMTPSLLAKYLGVSRATTYRYIENGLFKSLQIRGRTLVRRSDVDKVFEDALNYQKYSSPYQQRPPISPAPISTMIETGSGYTTVKEVAERYDMSLAGTDKLLKNSGITVIKHHGKHYYPAHEVEALFRKRSAESHPEISEWYTSAEVQEKFNLKPASVWDIVSKYRIPSKKVHNVTYYSKIHFDMIRGVQISDEALWYTVEQAMEKYSQTRDQVYNVLRYNSIERVQQGRYVKFRRKDYDETMKYVVRP